MSGHHEFVSTEDGLAGFSADITWAEETQRTVTDFLEAMSLEEDTEQETASGFAFCGCYVCITREVLFLVIPRVLQGAVEGRVQLL